LPKNKEVPDHKFGVPPVRWYANYRTLLKDVQTWGMFLQKLGLPDKREIPMYSRHFLRYNHCLNHSNLMLIAE
jgi:hypothetical protein